MCFVETHYVKCPICKHYKGYDEFKLTCALGLQKRPKCTTDAISRTTIQKCRDCAPERWPAPKQPDPQMKVPEVQKSTSRFARKHSESAAAQRPKKPLLKRLRESFSHDKRFIPPPRRLSVLGASGTTPYVPGEAIKRARQWFTEVKALHEESEELITNFSDRISALPVPNDLQAKLVVIQDELTRVLTDARRRLGRAEYVTQRIKDFNLPPDSVDPYFDQYVKKVAKYVDELNAMEYKLTHTDVENNFRYDIEWVTIRFEKYFQHIRHRIMEVELEHEQVGAGRNLDIYWNERRVPISDDPLTTLLRGGDSP